MCKIIRKLTLLFCSLLILQSASFAEVLEFAQVADVHYTLNDSYKEKYLHFLSLSLKKKYPDFVVFLGDNVAKSNEEKSY